MRISGLYSVYDRKAQYYLPAFQADTDVHAHRQFNQIINTEGLPTSLYPADFDLVRLGTVDTQSGEISPEYPVGLLVNGLVALEQLQRERLRYATLNREDPVDYDQKS